MKLPLLLICILVCVAGCEEISDTLHSYIPNKPEASVHVFNADPRKTYAAAKTALEQIGFHYVSGGPATGRLYAMSDVSAGDSQGSTHQFTLNATFRGLIDGSGTNVTLNFTEVIEADTQRHQGMGTEAGLKDTALVNIYYRAIAHNLGLTYIR
jgi:opacity protein-like surface antigen